MRYPYDGNITYDFVRDMYRKHGFKFYETGRYNVNLFAFRNKDLTQVDAFNDILGVAYLDQFMNKRCLVFSGTTKPGITYLRDKLGNKNGTAILLDDAQYPKCWTIGVHNAGKASAHEAYRQVGPGVFKVYRDNNMDGKFDMSGKIYNDVTGLNGHTTRDFQVSSVGAFSAACQVVEDDKEHGIWLHVGKRSAELYGNLFTFTIFREK